MAIRKVILQIIQFYPIHITVPFHHIYRLYIYIYWVAAPQKKIYVYIYVYVYICIYMYIYVYIYIYKLSVLRDRRYFNNLAQPVGSESQ